MSKVSCPGGLKYGLSLGRSDQCHRVPQRGLEASNEGCNECLMVDWQEVLFASLELGVVGIQIVPGICSVEFGKQLGIHVCLQKPFPHHLNELFPCGLSIAIEMAIPANHDGQAGEPNRNWVAQVRRVPNLFNMVQQ